MDWIKIEDNLPEIDQDVLVYQAGMYGVAHLTEENEWKDDHYCHWYPDAWMRLPEYK